jgi:Skp family chaperone for outer membrane proteins
VLVVATLGLALLAYLCLNNLPRRDRRESSFDLPAEPAASKLNEDQRAEASPSEAKAEPVEPAKKDASSPEALPAPAGPKSQRPPEPPLVEPPAEPEPQVELIVPVPREGVAPMTRSTSNFALQLFLLGWYLSSPTSAALAADTPAGETADRLQKIERALEDLKTQTAGLKDVNLKDLKDKVDTINKTMEMLDKLPLQVQANKRDIEKNAKDLRDVAEEVARLNEAVTRLQEELKSESRKAFSPAVPREAPAIPTQSMSTVRLVNAWSTPMTVLVDETSYRLQPGEVRPVTRKPGNMTYEVLGVQAAVPRTLVAGETLTIRIGPRQ